MSYLEPSALLPDPTTSPANQLDLTDYSAPLVPNLPASTTALTRKYTPQTLSSLQAAFPPSVVNALVKFDSDRAAKGQYPLTTPQSLNVLQAAQGKPPTKAPEKDPWDFLGNVADDVTGLVSNIPHIPDQLYKQVVDLPNFSKRVEEGGGGLEGLLSAPGINLIPGTHTARDIITGDFNDILTHPVTTALDVAPIAKGLHVGELVKNIPVGDATVGELGSRAVQALGRTTPGQITQEAFHPMVRRMMEGNFGQVAQMHARSTPGLENLHPDELSQLARDSVKFNTTWDKTFPDPVRRQLVSDTLQTDARGIATLGLNDAELAKVNQFLDLQHTYQQRALDAGNIAQRDVAGQTETLSTPHAKRVDAQQRALSRYRALNATRNAIISEGPVDVAALHATVTDALNTPGLTNAVRKNIARGYVHALDSSGYDTGALYREASSLTGPKTQAFLDNISAAQPTEGAVLTTRRTNLRDQWLSDNRSYTDKATAAREKSIARLSQRIVPSRWQPTVERAYADRIAQSLDTGDPTVLQALEQRDYGQLIDRGLISPDDLATWRNEAIQSWQQARASGANPEFVHKVSPEKARSNARGPRSVTTIAPTPSSYRDRTWDFTPANTDLGVSIDAQRLELLRQDGARAYTAWMESPEGLGNTAIKSRAQWEDDLRPAAQRLAQRSDITYAEAIERLFRKTAVPWDQTKTGFLSGSFGDYKFSEYAKRDALFVSRPVAAAMKRMTNSSLLERALAPSTGLFRTAVLPFSPRWHINNVLGNLFMAAVEDPRALLHLGQGFKVANSLRKVMSALEKGGEATVPADVAAILDSMSPTMRASMSSLEHAYTPDQGARLNIGKTAGKWWNQAQAAKSVIDKAADASYTWNQVVDDAFRASGYLSEYKRAIAKGLSAEEAAARGEALVNKFAPRWNQMTPLERSIIRPLVPFYSFLSHIVRYAYRYPVDHPFRVSVASSLIRNELEDYKTGLPQMFASLFGIGSPDASGNQTFIDVGAANPFRNLGDDLTLAGFLGETNPLFKVALQQAGYDPASKGPDLFPQVEYDPNTGKLRAARTSTPGLLGSLATSVIPQLNILGAITGTSKEFNALLQNNPAAASRMLLSQAGIPLMWKTVNVHETAFTSELNRETQQQNVLNAALKTGDYSQARRYPSLQPLLGQIEKLRSSGLLKNYTVAGNTDLQNAQTQLLAAVGGQ